MRYLLFLIIILSLSSCSLFNSEFEHLTGDYNIGYSNRKAYRVICKSMLDADDIGGIIRVPPYVYAVGYDERFIIAKSHPIPGDDHEGEPDTSITYFYVIDVTDKSFSHPHAPPLTKEKFDSIISANNLEHLKFTKHYPLED